ncbi:MAG TPA: GTPase ObgE [Caldisericia bacterium]|jgi:GTP-binding protein|nr:GTPase ObgE [Caldisericia bacterium]HPO28973.1 GTPase ObgE [Caldisericia bacterium]HQG81892.1 GTPase ObgE [Caldisericia bacterium]
MFIDEIEIKVKAGRGGKGVISFRREKYVPKGGPDGGCGGNGGDVYLIANSNISSLSHFKYNRFFKAEDGSSGESNNKTGKSGKNIYIDVPVGTLVYEKVENKYQFITDLSVVGAFSLIAKGGIGGRGNALFATSVSQAPRIAEEGSEGEEKSLYLELKLIADVGIVGLPNAGKSTLLSNISNAKPKIGDYPFTTLYPTIGIVEYSPQIQFTVADLPGIIKGASKGKGLGYKFLRHIERCKMLVFLVDLSLTSEDLINSLETIMNELKDYNEELIKREIIICGNKIDILDSDENIKVAKKYFEEKGYKYFFISGKTKEGVKEVLDYIAKEIKDIPAPVPLIKEGEVLYTLKSNDIKVERLSDHYYKLHFEELERIVNATDLSYPDSKKYLLKLFKKYNIDEILKVHNISEGDIVEIGDKRFEWI